MNTPFVIALAIIVCGLSFFKPIVGVFILVVTSWLGAIFPADGVFTLNRVLGIVAIAGIFAPQLIKPDKSKIRKFTVLDILFVIYFLILFLSSFYSIFQPRTRAILLDTVTGFLLYYLLKVTVVSKTHLENLVKTLVIISLVVAFYSLLAAQNANPLSKRIYGEFQVNIAGITCYVGVVCTLWLSSVKKLPTWAAGIISMILITVIFLSGNRTGMVALLILAMLFVLRIFLTSKKRGAMIGTLILFLIMTMVSFRFAQNNFPFTVDRAISIFSPSISNPAAIDLKRTDLIQAAWSMFLDHPLLGIGLGNFALNFGSYAQYFMQSHAVAHNLFMNSLAETGIIGFISLICIYIYIIYSNLRALSLKRNNLGIFDQWFPLMLFVGVNIINAALHNYAIDKQMFTVFAINVITLRNLI